MATVRVIAGSAKGRKLKVPEGEVRATSDRAKEGLFSSLSPRLVGARVLDLFAGSGSLGIEALSRGAVSAIFVEKDRGVARTLEQNISKAGMEDVSSVVVTDSGDFSPSGSEMFDLVFVDPPWKLGVPSNVLAGLTKSLTPDAIVVVGVRSVNLDVDAPPGFEVSARRRYGDSGFLFLEVIR